MFGYRLDARIDEIRPRFFFDVSCRGTVPPAILAFLESTDYENAVRLAVSSAATPTRSAASPEGSLMRITAASGKTTAVGLATG